MEQARKIDVLQLGFVEVAKAFCQIKCGTTRSCYR